MRSVPSSRPTERRRFGRCGSDELYQPRYDGASLPNLSHSVVHATGRELADDVAPLPSLAPRLDPFGGRRANGPIVIALIDGFGWDALSLWARGKSPAAARWRAAAQPIDTVFPSSTASALVSLSTGAAPSQHGVVGHRIYLPRFRRVIDLLTHTTVGVDRPRRVDGPGWNPTHVSVRPTIFRRGVPAVALSRDRFRDTGFTRLLYDGAEYVPYSGAVDWAARLVRLLNRPTPPEVVWTYWDELDTVRHLWGTQAALVRLELDRLASLVGYVATHVDRRRARTVQLVITGDHGLVPLDPAAQLNVATIPTVRRWMARPLAGDRRVGFFRARPGHRADLVAALSDRLPAGSLVRPVDSVGAAGLFGPGGDPALLDTRVGDLVAFVPVPHGLVDRSPSLPPPSRPLRSAHGSLTEAELTVPLIAGPLAAFRSNRRQA